MKFTDFIEKEIWQPMGPEAEGLMLNAGYGRAATPLGFSSTLRDLARFSMLFTPSGRKGESPIVSDSHLNKILNQGRPEILARSGTYMVIFLTTPKRHQI